MLGLPGAELQAVLSYLMKVLGIQLRSSGKAMCDRNYWATSPAQVGLLLIVGWKLKGETDIRWVFITRQLWKVFPASASE